MEVADLAPHTEIILVGTLARWQRSVHWVVGMATITQGSSVTYKKREKLDWLKQSWKFKFKLPVIPPLLLLFFLLNHANL